MSNDQRKTVLVSAAARDAAGLIGATKTATLATLEAGCGHPYASLVTVGLDETGEPVLLLSRLARHTTNLDADSRASLLFDVRDQTVGDPLTGGRVTVMGRAVPTARGSAAVRFLARHPEAEMYAGFADFRFFAMSVERAHFIGGFGRIVEIGWDELRSALVVGV
jgi:heme iron utilization protein